MVLGVWCLVPGAKTVIMVALCAVGLAAFAGPTAVQLWENGPYFATCNVGANAPQEYGILTKPTVTGEKKFDLGTGGELKGLKLIWNAKADFGDEKVHEKIKVKLVIDPVESN